VEPAVVDYLRRLVAEASTVLGEELVGVYAAGSVALDAYEPGRSDIDLALVCESSLPLEAKRRLVDRLRHDSLACPARGLELVVYRRGVAGSGTPEPGFELELNTGPAMAHRVTLRPEDRPEADGRFWYGLDRSILHQHGRALLGPPAAEVFADLTAEEVRTLLTASLRWWLERTPPGSAPTPGADDAVLGACRALVRHRTGRWTSKAAAAQLVSRDGHEATDLLRQAVASRRGGPVLDGERARAFQGAVLREVADQAASRRRPGGAR
jgi:hypothetical protein